MICQRRFEIASGSVELSLSLSVTLSNMPCVTEAAEQIGPMSAAASGSRATPVPGPATTFGSSSILLAIRGTATATRSTAAAAASSRAERRAAFLASSRPVIPSHPSRGSMPSAR